MYIVYTKDALYSHTLLLLNVVDEHCSFNNQFNDKQRTMKFYEYSAI